MFETNGVFENDQFELFQRIQRWEKLIDFLLKITKKSMFIVNGDTIRVGGEEENTLNKKETKEENHRNKQK